ncbi:hypothetical protein CHARACLAT_003736 [Characodon lateralis]|uniref:Uncharacterized protein n=1 Tax=Characodon lateralis TaxID=208331 RepID=A0ABU7DG24_9TELE|nr:hypothetical protein [Characodon lateralis]
MVSALVLNPTLVPAFKRVCVSALGSVCVTSSSTNHGSGHIRFISVFSSSKRLLDIIPSEMLISIVLHLCKWVIVTCSRNCDPLDTPEAPLSSQNPHHHPTPCEIKNIVFSKMLVCWD